MSKHSSADCSGLVNGCHVVEPVLLGDIKSTTDYSDIFHKPKAALQLHKLLWL